MDFELHRSGGPGHGPSLSQEQQRELELQRELERQRDQELMRPIVAAQLDEHIGQRPDLQDYLKQFKQEEQDKLKEAMTESLSRFAPHAKQIDHVQIGKEDGKLYVLSSKYFMGVADPAQALGISDEERLSLSRPAPTEQDRLAEPSRDQVEPLSRPQPERDTAPRTPGIEAPPQQAAHSEPSRYTGPLTLEQRQQQALQNIPLDASQVAEPHFENGVLALQPIPYCTPFGTQPLSHEPAQRETDIQQLLAPKLGNVLEGYAPVEQQQLTQALTDEISDITGSRLQIDHIERLEDGRISAELNRGLHHVYLDPQDILQPKQDIPQPAATLSVEEQLRRETQQQLHQQIEQLTQHPAIDRLIMESRLREAVGTERIESLRLEGEDTFELGLRNGMVLTATTHELLNMTDGRELLNRAQVNPAAQSSQNTEAGNTLVDPTLKDRPLGESIAELAQAKPYSGKFSTPYPSRADYMPRAGNPNDTIGEWVQYAAQLQTPELKQALGSILGTATSIGSLAEVATPEFWQGLRTLTQSPDPIGMVKLGIAQIVADRQGDYAMFTKMNDEFGKGMVIGRSTSDVMLMLDAVAALPKLTASLSRAGVASINGAKFMLRGNKVVQLTDMPLAGAPGGVIRGSGPLYRAREVGNTLESRYPGQVSSKTLPGPREKNVKLAERGHPKTEIPYDERGFPIFDRHLTYDTRIPRELTKIKDETVHMKAATRDLQAAIDRGEVNPAQFTPKQLEKIKKGDARIPEYTWHHHQDVGRMQLVPRELHRQTGHIGGYKMWFR